MIKLKNRFVVIIVIVLVAGCSNAEQKVVVSPSITLTNTVSPSATASITFSASISPVKPSSTPPEASTVPNPSSNALGTSTLDVASLITRTPLSPEQCPAENLELSPDFIALFEETVPNIEKPIIDFLNAGGTRSAIVTAISQESTLKNVAQKRVLEADLTGDSVPELVVSGAALYIFGCKNAQYQLLFETETRDIFHSPTIFAAKDLNLDGVPELVLEWVDCLGINPCKSVGIFEWDGIEFSSLFPMLAMPDDPAAQWKGTITPLFSVNLVDIDKNGTIELVLHGSGPKEGDAYNSGLPSSDEIDIYMWDGKDFVLASRE